MSGKIKEWRTAASPTAPAHSPSPQYESPSRTPYAASTFPASPFASPSFHHDSSPRPQSPTTPTTPTNSDRIIASSIFASRDRDAPHSPQGLGMGLQRTGSVSFPRSHRRAMTLPQVGEMGLPVSPGTVAIPFSPPGDTEVVGMFSLSCSSFYIHKLMCYLFWFGNPGLPGRTRLSRPAEINSPFAPSAVFSSSHGGLNRIASPGGGAAGAPSSPGLLPSQTVRAMDRQRQDLVAYEYLCHVAEYVLLSFHRLCQGSADVSFDDAERRNGWNRALIRR